MQFGKSKAKFQMEPNTGITFDDVAGVDEAKQDFMEVPYPCLSYPCFQERLHSSPKSQLFVSILRAQFGIHLKHPSQPQVNSPH